MSNAFLTTERISDNMRRTPDGFLLCLNVPIARTGALQYTPAEMPHIPPGPGQFVTVERPEGVVFSAETMASFNGKPVVIGHPSTDSGLLTPSTARMAAIGNMQNIRRGAGSDADKLLADLLITDAIAISLIESGQLREVSCGYRGIVEPTGPGRGVQTAVIGNHLALVDRGRAGAECAIKDHHPKGNSMNWFERAAQALGGRNPKELRAIADEMSAEEKQDNNGSEKKQDDEAASGDLTALEARVAALEAVVAKLAGAEVGEAKQGDESPSEPADKIPGAMPEVISGDSAARLNAAAAIVAPGMGFKFSAGQAGAAAEQTMRAALGAAMFAPASKQALTTIIGDRAPSALRGSELQMAFTAAAATLGAGNNARMGALAGLPQGDAAHQQLSPTARFMAAAAEMAKGKK